MIKIVGGTYRSRTIEVPPHLEVPSKSIVRTGVMNALGESLEGATVLDLFAGSGALGIEALSRGAKYCHFVDADKAAAVTIQNNLKALNELNAKVINAGFDEYLRNSKETYDVVFLDPPYKMKEVYMDVPRELLERKMLSDNAIVVLEYEGEIDAPKECFSRCREYHYGKSKVLILWRKP